MNECPLCHIRVSDWMMACGKTEEITGHVVHKSCLIDYEMRHGKKWDGSNGHDRTAGWSVGVPIHHPKAS